MGKKGKGGRGGKSGGGQGGQVGDVQKGGQATQVQSSVAPTAEVVRSAPVVPKPTAQAGPSSVGGDWPGLPTSQPSPKVAWGKQPSTQPSRPSSVVSSSVTAATSTGPLATTTVSSTAVSSTAVSSSSGMSSTSKELTSKMASLNFVPKELQLGPYPKRPDAGGNLGKKMPIRVNHYAVLLRPNLDICQYDVAISPEVSSRGVNRAILAEVMRLYGKPSSPGGPNLGGKLFAYDGMKILYTNGTLPGGEGCSLVFENLCLPEEGEKPGAVSAPEESDKPARRKRDFKVTIRFAARVNVYALQEYLAGRFSEQPQDAVNALDIVLRERPAQTYVSVGRSFFSAEFGAPHPLSGGAVAMKGFFQSLRPSQTGLRQAQKDGIRGLTLNLDMSSTPFLAPLPVPQFVAELIGRREGQSFSEQDRVKVKKTLRNVKVEVTHQSRRRKYRIRGLTDRPTKDLRFETVDPTSGQSFTVSMVQFFRNRYGVQLRYLDLPCLECGTDPSKKNWLPMEVCVVAAKQRYVRKLTPQQTSNMITAAKQFPEQRAKDIDSLVQYNDYANDPYGREFGIQINPKMMEVQARVLNPPKLKFSDQGREAEIIPRGGAWNMRDKKVVDPSQVSRWACINFAGTGRDRDSVNQQAADNFCLELSKACAGIGLRMAGQMILPVQNCVPAMPQVEQKLREVYAMASKNWPANAQRPPLDFLLCILPTTSFIYGDIKRVSELELGVVTQCVLSKNVPRCNSQYLNNVALKINPKTGGRNTWLVEARARRLPVVSAEPTIIFGADVTHPSPGDDSSPSIAAVVASQDWPEISSYRGLVRSQFARQEMIADLYVPPKKGQQPVPAGGGFFTQEGMVTELLRNFQSKTKYWPGKIIFFRDGVSEGQFDLVRDFEVHAIRKACTAINPAYKPKITFVVVQKRHHTRMFPTNPQNSDRSGNVLPGTVVDTDICSPSNYDFFLCSHAGLLGVSRPAKYTVLWDDSRLLSNDLQVLIYSLCYTYAIATRSVSVVPPAYYAHKLAFRARHYLPVDVSDSGSRRGGSGSGASGPSALSSRESQEGYNFHIIPELREAVKRVMFYC